MTVAMEKTQTEICRLERETLDVPATHNPQTETLQLQIAHSALMIAKMAIV